MKAGAAPCSFSRTSRSIPPAGRCATVQEILQLGDKRLGLSSLSRLSCPTKKARHAARRGRMSACRWTASARSLWDRLLSIPRRSRCAQRKIPSWPPYASCAADERGDPFAALRVTGVCGTRHNDLDEPLSGASSTTLHTRDGVGADLPRELSAPTPSLVCN